MSDERFDFILPYHVSMTVTAYSFSQGNNVVPPNSSEYERHAHFTVISPFHHCQVSRKDFYRLMQVYTVRLTFGVLPFENET